VLAMTGAEFRVLAALLAGAVLVLVTGAVLLATPALATQAVREPGTAPCAGVTAADVGRPDAGGRPYLVACSRWVLAGALAELEECGPPGRVVFAVGLLPSDAALLRDAAAEQAARC
jgi:hypothetical protein